MAGPRPMNQVVALRQPLPASPANEDALPPELLRFIQALAEADEAADYAQRLSQTTVSGLQQT
jgi:hypothetical protein